MTRSFMSFKKISLALTVAFFLVLGCFAVFGNTVRADAQSGNGWTLDEGVLTITDECAFVKPDNGWTNSKNSITKIVICGNVTSIPNSAFTNLSNLTTVELDGVETIGSQAFSTCRKLSSINLSEVNSIGEFAFSNTVLTSIDLSSVSSIGNSAFGTCKSLETVVLGNGLTSISDYAFTSCTKLSSINLGNVTSFGNSAFYYCKALNGIDLSNAVTISDEAFSNCQSLEKVTLSNAESVGKRAFRVCSKLNEVTLGNKVSSIGLEAFYGDTELTSINLENVTSIGEQAFYNCTKLAAADLSSLTSLGGYAFYGCAFSSVTLGENLKTLPDNAFQLCMSLSTVDLSNVETLGRSVFSGCAALETINLGEKIKVIPEYAFCDCASLKTIDLSNIESLSNNAFRNCDLLESVILGNSITEIPENAFSECENLTSINLDKVKTIDSSAFSCCYSLSEVDLSKVEVIKGNAFYGCALTEADLSNATYLEGYAFFSCEDLNKVTLSNKLTYLGEDAFVSTALANVYFIGTARQLSDIDPNGIFRNIPTEYSAFDVSFDIGGNVNVDDIQVVNKGAKATKPVDPTADGLAFTGWYTDNTCTRSYDFNTPVTADITLYAGWMKSEDDQLSVFKGHSISLAGDIAVNFYTELPEVLSNNAYMKFKVEGIAGEQKVLVKDAETVKVKDATYILFKCGVPAKNMTSVISASLVDNGEVLSTDTYSVKQYAKYILDHEEQYYNAIDLVKDMIRYGSYAQIYFKYKLNDLAYDILDPNERGLQTAMYYNNPYDPDKCVLPEGMTFSGVSLTLESDTVLKFYFTDTYTRNVKFYCNDVELVPVETNDGKMVKITGISAHLLDEDFTVKIVVEGDSADYQVVYSPLNYSFYVLAGPETEVRTAELKDLMLALLHYSQSAMAYRDIYY